jgi:hypothetical protein
MIEFDARNLLSPKRIISADYRMGKEAYPKITFVVPSIFRDSKKTITRP